MDVKNMKGSRRTGLPLCPQVHQLYILGFLSICSLLYITLHLSTANASLPIHASATLERCRQLSTSVGAPGDFYQRTQSDRFAPGTKPVLVQGAKIWTGRKNGTEVVHGDVLMDKGIIQDVGYLAKAAIQKYGGDLVVVNAKGAWVTPGIVDIHSHLGDDPSPSLKGATDANSIKATIQPWLRSLDGLNTHDDAYPLSIAGGVTTSLVLPGSADAIGGQAFVIKLRETAERSSSSMLLEPPYNINDSTPNYNLPQRWRHMKHACGENPSRVYSNTRMDTIWAFREAYNKARTIKEKQDEYCSKAISGKWKGLGEFPDDLQWEALVDVIRGRVKVNVHCYEAVDLDGLVRLSNEFKFPIAAFHHASEAYLVPELIKQAHGKPPAIALFATNARYKREAYRSSEFAPKVLAEHGLTVLMKSDHPVLNSRYLLYEAQQAHYYGFPENLAIASVTSNSAEAMGMGHRIGYVKEGWDADLVIWDSHPLALGATPTQVFIDGIPQLQNPHVVQKPRTFQKSPKVPNFDNEARQAVAYEGLPPLPPKTAPLKTVVFTNVKAVYERKSGAIQNAFSAASESELGVVVTRNGSIVCSGPHEVCVRPGVLGDDEFTSMDLEGGSISPGLVSYGSPLGLEHINQEASTNDGDVFDPLNKPVPKVLGGDSAIIRAVDGLQFGSRDALLAYRSGVTSAITAPSHRWMQSGLGTWFSLGESHKLEKGAIFQEVTGIHMSVGHFSKISVSTQIAALRHLLLGPEVGETGEVMKKVKRGQLPLVIETHNADIIATLILLKKEVEIEIGHTLRMTISGGSEAHLLAKELGEARIGVILNPVRAFPDVWEDRRILPGPPISSESAIMKLMSNKVVVGVGCQEIWSARNLPFDVAWAAIESGGKISKEEAFAIGSVNIETLLGGYNSDVTDLVATKAGDLLDGSKVMAVISPSRGLVHVFNSD